MLFRRLAPPVTLLLSLTLATLVGACDSEDTSPQPTEDFEERALEDGINDYGPEDFAGTTVETRGLVLNVKDLKPSETVSVIAYHGSQIDYWVNPDTGGDEKPFQFKVSATGFSDTASASQALQTHEPFAKVEPTEHLMRVDAVDTLGAPMRTDDYVTYVRKYRPGNTPNAPTPKPQPDPKNKKTPTTPIGKCHGPFVEGETTCNFHIIVNDYDQQEIVAELQYESERALFFVDSSDLPQSESETPQFTEADFANYADILDHKTLPKLNEYFGEVSDVDGNGKYIVVFSSLLKNRKANGYVAPWDLLANENNHSGWESNEADVVYINTPKGTESWGYTKQLYNDTVVNQTIAHETKHLIASGLRIKKWATAAPGELKQYEKPWIEEASAMAAVELCGLGIPSYTQPISFANYALDNPEEYRLAYERYPISGEELRAMYGFNMLFLWRLAERVGHRHFWKRLADSKLYGIFNIEDLMSEKFADSMRDFGLTLLFDGAQHGIPAMETYEYKATQINLRDGKWNPLLVRPFEKETGDPADLKNHNNYSYSFFSGQGAGRDAQITIRLTTTNSKPYFVVVRH